MATDFKTMFGNRIYIIGGTATIIGLFTVLTMLGFKITSTGDIYCNGTSYSPCISHFNVTNTNYRSVYIYNYDDIKMDFSPAIKDYKLYVKYYGKWVYTNFTMETRLGNIPDDRKYVFVFPAYSTKEFKLIGYKNNPTDIVKWSLTGKLELDPVWFPIKTLLKEDIKCYIEYWDEPSYETKCSTVYYDKNKTTSEFCPKHLVMIPMQKEVCTLLGWYYDKEYFSADEWCCSGNLCGFKTDYICEHIESQLKLKSHSYKELNTNILKIDDLNIKEKVIDKVVEDYIIKTK